MSSNEEKTASLQEYVFINLDIFKEKLDNNHITIDNDLEAWLTFLSVDDPMKIQVLTERYPEFVPLYEEVYDMCQNMERFMELFSKELLELDKNTVQYMMDEMQEELEEVTRKLTSAKDELTSAKDELTSAKDELTREKEKNEEMNRELERLRAQLKIAGESK